MTKQKENPNIVFFMVDQLSAKWLEASSKGICATPNLDKLRASGVSFNNAFTSNPVCCASRATLATGLTTRGHGVLENGYQLDPNLPTFMQALQQAGWHTGAVGKVHYQPHFRGFYPDYKPYGFDEIHITEDSRGGEWLDWIEKEHPEHYESVLSTIWPSKIPAYENYGPNKVNLKKRIEKIRETVQWATSEFPRNTGGAYTLPFPKEISQTEWITGHAERFLREADPNQPLYAHISYVQPHGPFCPPGQYMKEVNVDKIPAPAPEEWKDDLNAPICFKNKEMVKKDWEYNRHCFFADIIHLDDQLGRIIKVLEETGRMENTYVFFLSDHGELLGDHGFYGKEERHYDACIRIPLIISGPGLNKGETLDEFVQLEDICPTVLELTSQKLPYMPKMGPYLKYESEDLPMIPGKSLVALCQGKKPEEWRESGYIESYNPIWSASPTDWARTIRTHEYRYTFYPNGAGEQLFDIKNDPDEQQNLVAKEEYAHVRQKLRDTLLEQIVMQDYPKTRRNLYALGVH